VKWQSESRTRCEVLTGLDGTTDSRTVEIYPPLQDFFLMVPITDFT